MEVRGPELMFQTSHRPSERRRSWPLTLSKNRNKKTREYRQEEASEGNLTQSGKESVLSRKKEDDFIN